jgi:hypothetical protein
MDRAAVLRSRGIPGQTGEIRYLGQRQVHLAASAGVVEMADRVGKVRRQLLGIHQLQEGDVRSTEDTTFADRYSVPSFIATPQRAHCW